MLATAIIVFREVLEAALIVGIVMAASRGVPARGLWVGGGIAEIGAAGCRLDFGDIRVDMADRDDVVPLAGEPKCHRPAETAQPTGNNCDPLLHCYSPINSQ